MEGLDAAEKRRIVDLLKKGKDGEQSGSSMDWMYGEKKVDTDDYLLGKKIDKHFEKGDQTPPKEDDIFGERIKANIALDMQAKMREDPLYAIKKREEESRRKILQNPVKMKELQKLIAQQKKERKKKKKKHKHKRGSSDDEDDDDDDDLVQQYLSILTQKHGQEHHHDRKAHQKGGDHRSSSLEPGQHRHRSKGQHQNEGNKGRHTCKKNRKEHKQQKPGSSPESDQPSLSRPVHKSGGRRKASGSPESGKKRYGLIKSSKHQSRSRSRSRSPLKYPGEKSPPRQPSLQSGRFSHSSRSQQLRPRGRSPRRRDHQRMRRSPTPPKRKVSNEERERRLKEMLDNAKWREDQRKNNVQRYKEEDQREEVQRKKKGSSADFLNPLMSQHATNSTVEDRLRRNKYNIQRTKAALDKDFTKH